MYTPIAFSFLWVLISWFIWNGYASMRIREPINTRIKNKMPVITNTAPATNGTNHEFKNVKIVLQQIYKRMATRLALFMFQKGCKYTKQLFFKKNIYLNSGSKRQIDWTSVSRSQPNITFRTQYSTSQLRVWN